MIEFNIGEIILFENIVILFDVTMKLWFNEISTSESLFIRVVVYADELWKCICILLSYSI